VPSIVQRDGLSREIDHDDIGWPSLTVMHVGPEEHGLEEQANQKRQYDGHDPEISHVITYGHIFSFSAAAGGRLAGRRMVPMIQ
jgi:hypothetical protein